MSVTLVIVNYNSSDLLARCLACVACQTRPADDIIIVDNASTEPASLALLDSLDSVNVIRSSTNLGYGAAINLAARSARDTAYLACLNPDAFPSPGWLEALLNAADQHPGHGSFASLMLRDDDDSLIDGTGDELHFTGIPWRRYHLTTITTLPATGPVFSACGGAALYRTACFHELGGFDESYFMYIEDIDLGFRLQLSGYPCLFVREAVVRHVGSAITGERSDFSTYHGHRNLVYNYFKNMPGWLLLASLPFHLLANLLTLIVLAARGSGGPAWRAKKDALKHMPAALRARRQVERRVPASVIWGMLSKRLYRTSSLE